MNYTILHDKILDKNIDLYNFPTLAKKGLIKLHPYNVSMSFCNVCSEDLTYLESQAQHQKSDFTQNTDACV